MTRLTKNQEEFCQHIASGKTATDAFLLAYPAAQKWKREGVWVNASRLASKAKVKLRIEQLRDELAKKHLWTREMSVKALVQAYTVARDSENPNAMTGAVKELNAMHGYNEPQKIDHTSSDGSMSRSAVELTDEQLARIVNNES